MSETIIVCESYGTIERTLYLAAHNCPVTIVIPRNHDLFRFFQAINERVFHNTVNLVYLAPVHPQRATARGIKKVFHVLVGIIKERRYLKEIFDKYFAELEGCEIFFSSRSFSGYLFYLLKKLAKRNKLVHINTSTPHFNPMSQYTPTSIVDLVSLIIGKLTYGHDITLGKLSHTKGFLYMPDRFLEKEVDRVIERAEMGEMMKGFDLSQFRVFDVGNYSVIYFDQPLVEAGYVTDSDSYSRKLTEIFDILSKYFPEKEIARKYRPNSPGDKTVIRIGDVLPDFIPAEFLYNENVKMYLVVSSTSIAKLEKGLAVSVMDFISYKSDEVREHFKKVLIQLSCSEILFPKSLGEFEKILIDLKEKIATK